MRRQRVRGALVLLMAASMLVAACAAPADRSLPPPRSTSSTEPEPTTTEPDYSQVALAPVEGATTTAPPITEGRSAIRGVVTGPEGALPEAFVRIERLVGDVVQRTDVRTGPDGRYELAGVPGGRYRVRAYLPPALTSQQTEIFYLIDGDERELALATTPFEGVVARASTTPAAPVVGDGVNLAVRVAAREVDADGVGREVPVAGVRVQVNTSGWTELADNDAAFTSADGVVVFEYRCDRVTSVSATAVVGGTGPEPDGGSDQRPPAQQPDDQQPDDQQPGAQPGQQQEVFPLDVPPCAPRPTTTTSAPSSTSTSSPGGSTATTTTTTGG